MAGSPLVGGNKSVFRWRGNAFAPGRRPRYEDFTCSFASETAWPRHFPIEIGRKAPNFWRMTR
jgi:hypothetical protein